MPAPLGNKYAVGNNGGRPPVHDKQQLAKDLYDWSLKMYSVCLNQFYRDKGLWHGYITEWANKDKEFANILLMVRANIAANREDLLNKGALHVASYHQNFRTYNKVADEQYRSEKQFEANCKAETEKSGNVNVYVDSKPYKEDTASAQVSMQAISDSDMEGSE